MVLSLKKQAVFYIFLLSTAGLISIAGGRFASSKLQKDSSPHIFSPASGRFVTSAGARSTCTTRCTPTKLQLWVRVLGLHFKSYGCGFSQRAGTLLCVCFFSRVYFQLQTVHWCQISELGLPPGLAGDCTSAAFFLVREIGRPKTMW